MDKQVLLDVGLSKNEVEVYLALMALGPASAVSVAKRSGLHRPNVYVALDSLTGKGLVGRHHREKSAVYEVVDPDQLMSMLKTKEESLRKTIPELKLMQLNALPSSDVTVLDGIAGARKCLNDILDSTKEFFAVGVPKEYAKIVGEGWIAGWHERRVQKKIRFYHLVNHDYYAERVKRLRALPYTTLKLLPPGYGTPNLVIVYDAGVLLSFMNPFITIRILNKDLVTSFKHYYSLLDKVASEE